MQKVLLVTGGSRGIGASVCRLAAQSGYAVAINYAHNQGAAQALCEQITQSGGKAMTVQADVSDPEAVEQMFLEIDRQLGCLTHLVNNAGVLEQQADFSQIDLARWRRVFDVNVYGVVHCTQAALIRMAKRKADDDAAIVNVSSAAARIGAPFEYIDYAASKGALDSLTLGLAKEVAAQGIRVNAVRPGLIETDIHAAGGEPGRVARLAAQVPLQRGGQADEVAQSILWLLSDSASYVTGTLLDVTGGR